jgi:tight adherence protein B
MFLAFIFFFQIFFSFLSKKRKFKQRLEDFVTTHEDKEKKNKKINKKEASNNQFSSFIKKIGRQLDGAPNVSKWEKKLIQANSSLSLGEFLFFRIVCAIAIMAVGFLFGLHPLLLIPLGVGGFWYPVLDLKNKTEKRLNRCSFQLAEALGTMANSMRAGFSFMQAMKLISEEYPDPLGPEFKKTLQDIQYGVSVEEAFMRMLERLPDKELEMAVKAMLVQRSSGGNLSVLLETIQETISGRIQIKQEVKTLTAQGKMSSWIITGLPVALALYLKMVNPEYFNTLFTHPIGYLMLIMACLGIVVGWIMIRKIIRIEV